MIITDEKFNSLKWIKRNIKKAKQIENLFKGKKIIGVEMAGGDLPDGLLFYLDDGRNTIDVIDVFSEADDTQELIGINTAKIKKSEVL